MHSPRRAERSRQHNVQAEESSPVDGVPEDVLSTIFEMCLPVHGKVDPTPSQAPVLLTHVCHGWREHAHNLPMLWRSFYIGGMKPVHGDAAMKLVPIWFGRCPGVPTSLQIIVNDDIHRDEQDLVIHSRDRELPQLPGGPFGGDIGVYFQHMQRNIQYLMGLRRRLESTPGPPRNFNIMIQHPFARPKQLTELMLSSVPVTDIAALPESSFPSIRRLAISLTSRGGMEYLTSNDPIGAFADCSNLREVAIRPFDCGQQHPRILLPWSMITRFLGFGNPHVPWSTTSHFFNLHLPLMKSLQSLTLELDHPGLIIPAITLHSVNTLTLIQQGRYGTAQFWEKCHFPNLRALRLVGLSLKREFWTAERLARFDHIEYLCLDFRTLPSTDLRDILCDVPQITTLDVPICAEFFVATKSDGGDGGHPVLPNLRTLVWSHRKDEAKGLKDFMEETVQDIYAFVTTRRARDASSNLEKVVVYTSSPAPAHLPIMFVQSIRTAGCAFDGVPEISVDVHVVDTTASRIPWSLRDPELCGWIGLDELVDYHETFRNI